jgi:uncharacterized protein (DUF433 family)
MLTQDQTFFTPTEAAAVTKLPLKAVNNAIDKKTITARTTQKGGVRSRLVEQPALVYLSLERDLVADTTPSFRRKLFRAIAAAPARGAKRVAVGTLTLDIGRSWREVTQRIRDLRRAERLASTDADILGGVPVFRGTRIPIHAIADLLRQGEMADRLRKGYPRLTDEMIRLAPIYADAHPLRGRPRRQAWHGQSKGRVLRVRLREGESRRLAVRSRYSYAQPNGFFRSRRRTGARLAEL